MTDINLDVRESHTKYFELPEPYRHFKLTEGDYISLVINKDGKSHDLAKTVPAGQQWNINLEIKGTIEDI